MSDRIWLVPGASAVGLVPEEHPDSERCSSVSRGGGGGSPAEEEEGIEIGMRANQNEGGFNEALRWRRCQRVPSSHPG